MSQFHKPKTCDVCGSPTRVTTNREIFGRAAGTIEWFIHCSNYDCGAYAKTRRTSLVAAGEMVTPTVRRARIKAHEVFDKLWKNSEQRTKAYLWLAKEMGLEPKDCHISKFNEEQCLEVVRIVENRQSVTAGKRRIEHVPSH